MHARLQRSASLQTSAHCSASSGESGHLPAAIRLALAALSASACCHWRYEPFLERSEVADQSFPSVSRLTGEELEQYKGKGAQRIPTSDNNAINSAPFSAYCRQPALRLRFSASEFQALASVLNKY